MKRETTKDYARDCFYRGIVAYKDKDYSLATNYFNKCLEIYDDEVVKQYLQHSRYYLGLEDSILVPSSRGYMITYPYKAKVVEVYDGNIIIISNNTFKERIVKLYGIECPEKSQPYGEKAKTYISNLIYKKKVEINLTSRGIDYIANKNISKKVLLEGLAWVNPNCHKDLICEKFKKLQAEAKKKKIGLWKDKSPIPPWEWRKRKLRKKYPPVKSR